MGYLVKGIVEIPTMLPAIDSQEWDEPSTPRIASTSLFDDLQATLCIYGQPYPSTTEDRHGRLGHLPLKGIHTTKVIIDGIDQTLAGCLILRYGHELLEIESMIKYLPCIVIDGSIGRLLHDLLHE